MQEDSNIFNTSAVIYEQLIQDNIGFFGKDISYYAEHKSIVISQNTRIDPKRILEFGCGVGRNLPFLKERFPNAEVFGYDISKGSLAIAKENFPDIPLIYGQTILDFEQSFDIVLISNVLHHVSINERLRTLSLARQVIRGEGELFVVEHNPNNFFTRHAVNTCPLDDDAILLPKQEAIKYLEQIGFKIVQDKYTLFFPSPLRFMQPLEKCIGTLRFGAQYFVQAKKS